MTANFIGGSSVEQDSEILRIVCFRIKGDRIHEPLHPLAITAIEEHLRCFATEDLRSATLSMFSVRASRLVATIMSNETIRYIFTAVLMRAGQVIRRIDRASQEIAVLEFFRES